MNQTIAELLNFITRWIEIFIAGFIMIFLYAMLVGVLAYFELINTSGIVVIGIIAVLHYCVTAYKYLSVPAEKESKDIQSH